MGFIHHNLRDKVREMDEELAATTEHFRTPENLERLVRLVGAEAQRLYLANMGKPVSQVYIDDADFDQTVTRDRERCNAVLLAAIQADEPKASEVRLVYEQGEWDSQTKSRGTLTVLFEPPLS